MLGIGLDRLVHGACDAPRARGRSTSSVYAHRAETLERARTVGFADSLHRQRSQAVQDADLVVLATPVGAFGALGQGDCAASQARRDCYAMSDR